MKTILRKHIITIIILIIIGIASLAMVIILFSSMKTKIYRVLETKELLSSYQKNNKAYREESEQFKLLEKRLGSLEERIVSNQTIPVILSFLEDLAQKGGTDFEITSVQTPTKNEKKMLVLDFNISGSYTAVRLFLDQIQHQAYQVKFSKLEMLAENSVVQAVSPVTKIVDPSVVVISKEKQWQATATIEILSF